MVLVQGSADSSLLCRVILALRRILISVFEYRYFVES
jgi:hypothetical protein